MDEYCKRSGQIPAFGDWDYANEMPITQYFESARQAGLIRYSSSSGESDPYIRAGAASVHHHHHHLHKKTRVREKRGSNVKEMQKRQMKKVCDVTEPPRKQQQVVQNFNNNNNKKKKLHPQLDVVSSTTTAKTTIRPSKAVDEDLYKIPPELLHSSKRKKMPGFFSCLVPACAS